MHTNPGFDMVFFDKEIENITNLINQYSHTRPLDANTVELLKTNFEHQKEFLSQT